MHLARNQALRVLERDIDAIILGFNPSPYPSIDRGDSISIKAVEYVQGYALLSVSLPEAMIKGFVAFLEGFHETWRMAQFGVKCAKAEKKVVDPVEIEKREVRQSEYRNAVFDAFDDLISQGIPVKEVIKQVNVMIKDRFAWSDYSTVFTVLSESGRLKGTGYYRKVN